MDESIVKHLESPLKTLKLSEAIRIGARLRPQCRFDVFARGKSCAIGAAIEGRGGKYIEGSEGSLDWHLVPDLFECGVYTNLGELIFVLNDHRKMTREEIAYLLELRGL